MRLSERDLCARIDAKSNQPALASFNLETSACNCSASSFRLALPLRMGANLTEARTECLLKRFIKCGTSVMSFQ